jgi:predicted nucleic acid-binding protein
VGKLVIDASVSMGWCLPDERNYYSDEVLQFAIETGQCVAPALWGLEVRNSLLVALKRGRISNDGVNQAIWFLKNLNIDLVDTWSYDSVFELAVLFGLTVYDASYLDVALHERLPLATLDRRLAVAATRAGVSVFHEP